MEIFPAKNMLVFRKAKPLAGKKVGRNKSQSKSWIKDLFTDEDEDDFNLEFVI